MNERNLIGKCGLYCGACTIYRAQRDSAELRKKLSDKFKCTPEEVCCNGCGALTSDCWGNGCKIVVCTREKGVNYCYECREYKNNSCSRFDKLCEGYLRAGINLRSNLQEIENGNIDELTIKSQKIFTCCHCDKPIIVGEEKCHHCGMTL